MAEPVESDNERGRYPRWFGYAIAVLLGLAFIAILFSITWNTALETNRNQFTYESVSLKETIAHNVLVHNNITNNVAAFINSQSGLTRDGFNRFSNNMLALYPFITTIAYFPATTPESQAEFPAASVSGGDDTQPEVSGAEKPAYHLPALYQVGRGRALFQPGHDIRTDPQYRLIIQSLRQTDSAVASTIRIGGEEHYGLFRMIRKDQVSSATDANPVDRTRGVVLVAANPDKFLGNVKVPGHASLTFYNEFASLGRQLLFRQDAENAGAGGWLIKTLEETHQVQLPAHAVKLNISRNIYWDDIEKELVYIALFIGFAVTLLLVALVRAKDLQASELRQRNIVIERTVKEQTKELAIARDKAVEGSRMKSEFLASMSHEIRTPLNAIIGMSELLSETRLTDEQEKYISVFRRAGDTLLSLVNDILDLSKIEAHQLTLENIPFDITDVVEESTEIYALKAAEKNIELIAHVDTALNTRRMGDPARLRQIILNLISNALKFIDTGEIEVHVTAAEEQHPERVRFSVRDTGIGIPENKLTAIFENFTQADSSTTRKYGGTGLGLSICKSLVALMQGHIWVESVEGEGSEFAFVINLPLVAGEQAEAEAVAGTSLVGRTVALAAANATNRRVIAGFLEHHDVRVNQAATAGELLQFLSASGPDSRPDLVMVDFRWPDMDTYKLIASIRQQQSGLRIVLMISPGDLNDHMAKIRASGIDYYLVKPVKQRELLHLFDKREHVAKPATDMTGEAVAGAAVKHRKILLVDDNPDNRMLVKAFLKKAPYEIEEAENGEMAVASFCAGHHDLVLMDVQMPVMDGHEASRQIRKWETEQGHAPRPIIALTAHATREEVDKCVAAGCDSHLSKPVKKSVLLEALETYLPG